jgi:hypothetical protein
MALLARCRLALARHPWLYWLCIAACAVLLWSSVHDAQAAADRAHSSWGTTRTVWVADVDLAAGDTLRVSARSYPSAMVTRAAITSIPADARASHPVAAGAIVTATDLRTTRAPGDDWVVFALPADGAPSLIEGDGVAVFGGSRRLCDGIATRPAASGTPAAASISATVEVAVDPRCAPAVSDQLAAHTVVIGRSTGAIRSTP